MFFPSPKHFQHIFFFLMCSSEQDPYCIIYFSEAKYPQIQQLKPTDIYHLLFSVDRESGTSSAGRLWLRVSLEVAVQRCHRAATTSRLSEAERPPFHLTFTWLLADLRTQFLDDFLLFSSLGMHTHAQMHIFPILPHW